MAKLRELGWLVVRRQGARGRVSQYRLDIGRMLDGTRAQWPAIGPDFVRRLDPPDPAPAAVAAMPSSVVPFPLRPPVAPGPASEANSVWSRAQSLLHHENPSLFAAWFRVLRDDGRDGSRLLLRAPSRFHASYVATHLLAPVIAACRSVDRDIADVAVRG